MSPLARRAAAFTGILVALPAPGCAGRAQEPERRFADGALTSSALPAFTFRADTAFRYAGRFPIRIEDIAGGERHVFLDTAGGRVERMILIQFEGFLPGVSDSYRYPMRNPVTLGGQRYTHGTFVFSQAEAIRQGPGREVDSTVAYLTRKGLVVPDEQLVARFARILGDDARNEVIIFYQEAAEPQRLPMAKIATADGFRREYAWVSDSLTARALRAFTISEPRE